MANDENHCLDCGRPIYHYSKRCHSCAAKVRWAQGSHDGMSEKIKAAHVRGCFDGIRTPESRAKQGKRMKEAWARGDMDGVHTPKSNAKISLARRAMWEQGVYDTPEFRDKVSNNTKAAWENGAFANRDSPEYREKISKGVKEAWARGDFDGVFVSPTNPERIIKEFLDGREIEHEFQFRLGGHYYDFYIPDRNLLIEYDGVYWHSLPGAKERDEEKTRLALENNYMLIRLQSQPESEVGIRFLIEKGLSR